MKYIFFFLKFFVIIKTIGAVMQEILNRLSKSKFRSSFRLKQKDIDYINAKGIETIKNHAYDFIAGRLSDTSKVIDGKQTPTKGHPVFVAQHATATCCRECLNKWHKIPKNRLLTEDETNQVVGLIIEWINNEYNNFK